MTVNTNPAESWRNTVIEAGNSVKDNKTAVAESVPPNQKWRQTAEMATQGLQNRIPWPNPGFRNQ
jgi:hypothetical protein